MEGYRYLLAEVSTNEMSINKDDEQIKDPKICEYHGLETESDLGYYYVVVIENVANSHC